MSVFANVYLALYCPLFVDQHGVPPGDKRASSGKTTG